MPQNMLKLTQVHHYPAAMNRFGFLFCLLVPALMPAAILSGQQLAAQQSVSWANTLMWLPLFVLYVILPCADYALGRDTRNAEVTGPTALYAALPAWCALIQFALLWYVLDFAVSTSWLSITGWLGLMLSFGIVSGINAINVAHELIHKKARWQAWLGGLLLTTVAYAGFKVEHVRGHHVWVSTPRDPSSASAGQSLFAFLPRSIWNNLQNAWQLEAKRLTVFKLPAWHWRNEMLWWYSITTLLAALITWQFGWTGLLVWAGQALLAIVSLEIINYVEHYGLRRRQLASGRFERPSPQDSWNSDFWLSNQILLHLQRHSDHHANPRTDYQNLKSHSSAPQLPAGYATMFLLALVPPLWFRFVDPRLPAYPDKP